MIYIAHPNDQATPYDEEGASLSGVLSALEASLTGHEVAAYWPTRPFTNAGLDCPSTYDVNEFAVRRCDGMLAVMLPGIPSVGVPMEILTAHQLGKPVAVIGGVWSLQFRGMKIPQFKIEEIFKAVEYIKNRTAEAATLRLLGAKEEIKWVGDPDCEPRRSYPGDAGWDLVVERDVSIWTGHFADVPHGISIEMPPTMWGLITGRSSTIRRRGLLVVNGIIDSGYRGELFAACQNLSDKTVHIKKGERLAQLIPFRLESQGMPLRRVAELSEHDRGLNAFGSTGS